MNINEFIKTLDKLFEQRKLDDVEPFLMQSMEQAEKESDLSAQFTILNEMMGFFRDTSQYEKSISACNKCLSLMKKMGIEGSATYATSLQNIANAYRAAGMLEDSLGIYQEVFAIYENSLPKDDYKYASLHNNIALLYQEMNNFEMAVNHLKYALDIICKIDGAKIEVATTYTNLGASLLELNRVDEAVAYLEKAIAIYRKDTVKNFHYSGALSAMAAAECRKGNYETALTLYEEALGEIEINMGKGSAYQITKENLEKVRDKIKDSTEKRVYEQENCKNIYKEDNPSDIKDDSKTRNIYRNDVNDMKASDDISGLELARRFYEEIGAPMIRKKFPEYEGKIAVGLVGEGSERFGFDDEYSKDHDFGPGFCMWVTKETYEVIGKQLQKEYEKLPQEYLGVKRVDTKMAKGRCGVQIIGDFYEKYTGYRIAPQHLSDWIEIEDYQLATVTNGEIFRDDEGIFSAIRQRFLSEPRQARLVKIAREIATMAQTGQANYARSMGRRDYVTAKICIAEYMQHTMKCIYLLNGKYAPYYKWLYEGTKNLEILPEVGDIMCAIADMPDQREAWENYHYNNMSVNENDNIALTIEIVAKLILNELKNQGIIAQITTNFLNDYVGEIMEKAKVNRDEIIDEIVKLEFEAFDKVKNVGGRAMCQDDFPFFYIMRKSQYLTWSDEMLLCIRNLWLNNKEKGWNMITEKYGRMMESTSPDEYEKIAKHFPKVSEQTIKIVDQIVEIQVEWMKDFAKEYPKLATQTRDVTSDMDAIDNTSYETYLRGELLTYSEELIKLYAEFIVDLYRRDKNLARMTIENTAKLQGYKSLEEAENSIS